MAKAIKLPFALRIRVGPMNHILHDVYRPTWEGAIFSGKQADHCKVQGHSAVICTNTAEPIDLVLRFVGSSGTKDAQVQLYSSLVRWCQYALIGGHVAVTCQITVNHPSMVAMRLVSNYFDQLLSLDTPTQTVAQIAERFESNTVLWAFHIIQPSSFKLSFFATIIHQVQCIINKLVSDGKRSQVEPTLLLSTSKRVIAGKYQDLPDVSRVDWSLLKLEVCVAVNLCWCMVITHQ